MTSLLSFVAVAVFFVLLLGIAAWGLSRTGTVHDFFLGGRTLGPWILAISYGATYFSAVIFVGFAGQFGWKFGLQALWVGVANAVIGGGMAWLVLGRRTRRMTHNLQAMTIPEFFSARYTSNGLKLLSAAIIFVFLIPYTASVFKGLAHLFQIVLGANVPFPAVLAVITGFSFLYVTFGGYKAIARIDFILGGVILLGSLAMLLMLLNHFGGLSEVLHRIPARLADRVALSPQAPLHISKPPAYVLPAVVFMTSFGVWGLPQMLHKFYAIKDEREITRGAVITTLFALVIGGAAYLTGAMSHLMPEALADGTAYPALKNLANGVHSIDFDKLVPDLIRAVLPRPMLLLILLLVLSASLSTLSSLVLVSASAITIDLYKGYLNPNASEKTTLRLMRLLCGLFILCAFLLTLHQPSWIVTLMSLSWGAVAGAFLAPYLYGLYNRRATKTGAYVAMFCGLVVCNGGYLLVASLMGRPQAQALSPVLASAAMVIPLLAMPLTDSFARKPSKETIDRAFR
ncbi:MAG: sodium:solute symporter [Kiritimatiellia bacterium]